MFYAVKARRLSAGPSQGASEDVGNVKQQQSSIPDSRERQVTDEGEVEAVQLGDEETGCKACG